MPFDIAMIIASVVAAIILLMGVTVVWLIVTNRINLTHLVSEPVAKGDPDGTPKASLSRFQFLIFTFVIAGLYLALSLEAGTLIEVPNGALMLLGISGGSYLASKYSRVGETDPPSPPVQPTPQQRAAAKQAAIELAAEREAAAQQAAARQAAAP